MRIATAIAITTLTTVSISSALQIADLKLSIFYFLIADCRSEPITMLIKKTEDAPKVLLRTLLISVETIKVKLADTSQKNKLPEFQSVF